MLGAKVRSTWSFPEPWTTIPDGQHSDQARRWIMLWCLLSIHLLRQNVWWSSHCNCWAWFLLTNQPRYSADFEYSNNYVSLDKSVVDVADSLSCIVATIHLQQTPDSRISESFKTQRMTMGITWSSSGAGLACYSLRTKGKIGCGRSMTINRLKATTSACHSACIPTTVCLPSQAIVVPTDNEKAHSPWTLTLETMMIMSRNLCSSPTNGNRQAWLHHHAP